MGMGSFSRENARELLTEVREVRELLTGFRNILNAGELVKRELGECSGLCTWVRFIEREKMAETLKIIKEGKAKGLGGMAGEFWKFYYKSLTEWIMITSGSVGKWVESLMIRKMHI